MKAIWKDKIVAEAEQDDLVNIEGNWYFPPSSVDQKLLRKSDTPYTCPWKGVCQFFDVGESEDWSEDNAWCYPEPMASAAQRVGREFAGYIAFYGNVKITD